MPVKIAGAEPSFATVTRCAGEVAPRTRSPKPISVGDTRTIAIGAGTARAATAICTAPPSALLSIVATAWKSPSACELKPRRTPHDCPGMRFKGQSVSRVNGESTVMRPSVTTALPMFDSCAVREMAGVPSVYAPRSTETGACRRASWMPVPRSDARVSPPVAASGITSQPSPTFSGSIAILSGSGAFWPRPTIARSTPPRSRTSFTASFFVAA